MFCGSSCREGHREVQLPCAVLRQLISPAEHTTEFSFGRTRLLLLCLLLGLCQRGIVPGQHLLLCIRDLLRTRQHMAALVPQVLLYPHLAAPEGVITLSTHVARRICLAFNRNHSLQRLYLIPGHRRPDKPFVRVPRIFHSRPTNRLRRPFVAPKWAVPHHSLRSCLCQGHSNDAQGLACREGTLQIRRHGRVCSPHAFSSVPPRGHNAACNKAAGRDRTPSRIARYNRKLHPLQPTPHRQLRALQHTPQVHSHLVVAGRVERLSRRCTSGPATCPQLTCQNPLHRSFHLGVADCF